MIASIPAADRPGRKTQFGVRDHAGRIEILRHTQAIAARAGAHRRVERKQARFQLRQRVVAHRAGIARGKQLLGRGGIVHVHHARQAIAQAQCGFEGFGQALLDVLTRAEAIDHRFDGVLHAQCELGRIVQLDHFAIHARAHQTLCAKLFEHLHMLALALADHRRQQHVAAFGIERERGIDHLADGLRFQREVMFRAARRADARVQQAQVVVDLGDRADGGARVVRGGFLFDGNGR